MPKQPRQLNFQVIMDVIKALKIDVPVMNYEAG